MQPVVTPDEMGRIDAQAPVALTTLIRRAGWAVAHEARDLLDGTYGRRILVLAGRGNNGADGRAAAEILERWGAAVTVRAADDERPIPPVDLVIDAALGTGVSRAYEAPPLLDLATPVLAVDLPSGIDPLTGAIRGRPLAAVRTVVLGTHKPGPWFPPARDLAGEMVVAPIGLDCSRATIQLLDDGDLDRWPERAVDAHKWKHAVWIVGGGDGHTGAPTMNARAAQRAGAGFVRLSVPRSDGDGGPPPDLGPVEAVGHALPDGWSERVLADVDRFAALVVGSGLPTDVVSSAQVRDILSADLPLVLDAGAIDAVRKAAGALEARSIPAVLTPHDGEFSRLTGVAPDVLASADRIAAARRAADEFSSVIVLKGPTTVIAEPGGAVRLSAAGDQRLATAGTGDVLAGTIGAGLALGLEPFEAASLGPELMGRAARRGGRRTLVAGDLPDLIAAELEER